MVWIPSLENILSLFRDNIHTGTLFNRQGLISTLDKVKWGVPFLDSISIWDQVTILFKEIVENRYFSDGNKRIGILIAFVFLFKNGFNFSPEEGEIYEITIAVAQGLKSYDDLKLWFRQNSINIT